MNFFKRPSAHYGKTPEPETPYQTRRPGLGRAHRLGPRPGAELAADGLRLADPVGRLRRGAGLAVGARHRRALGGAGRQARRGAGRRAGRRRLSADRSADRLAPGALHRAGPLDSGRSRHRPAELAARLRLHDRSRRGRAQRLCPRQRSVHQGRQAADRRRGLERHPRLAGQLPRRLDRAPLRERPARRHRALDRHPHRRRSSRRATPSGCARTRSASTSTPSTGRRSWGNDAAGT